MTKNRILMNTWYLKLHALPTEVNFFHLLAIEKIWKFVNFFNFVAVSMLNTEKNFGVNFTARRKILQCRLHRSVQFIFIMQLYVKSFLFFVYDDNKPNLYEHVIFKTTCTTNWSCIWNFIKWKKNPSFFQLFILIADESTRSKEIGSMDWNAQDGLKIPRFVFYRSVKKFKQKCRV